MRLDDQQVASLVQRLLRDNQVRDESLRLRRALVFRRQDDQPAASLGIHVPAPFDESRLILKSMSGRLSDAAQFIAATVSLNPPLIQVNTVSTTDSTISTHLQRKKTAQEHALNGIYYDAQRRARVNLQQKIAWGQAVDGVAWYISYPREAGFGLPDRAFYDDLSDEEVATLVASGDAILDPLDVEDKPKESADLWFAHRKEAAKVNALDGKTLFKVEVKPAASVYVDWDGDAIATAAIIEEVPTSRFERGGDMARMTAAYLDDTDFHDGILLNADGQIVAGIPEGTNSSDGDFNHNRFTFVRLFFRDEIYYFASGIGNVGGGKILWASKHNMREVPFYPAYGTVTNSVRPEERFLALLDGEFAYTPLINQAATFISSAAAFDAFPRFVIETREGLVPDPENPSMPMVVERGGPLGLDPEEVAIVHGGTVKQLRVEDTGLLLNMLEFFLAQESAILPSEAETGSGGTSGPAWGTRLKQQAATKQYKPAVESNAAAVAAMAGMQSRTLRLLGETVGFLSAPAHRGTKKGIRFLIEVNTKDFTDDLRVMQSPNTLEEQITLRQVGISQRQAGVIDDMRMVEDYFGEPDALDYVLDMYVQRVVDATLLGPNEMIPPGSLLFEISQAARGHAVQTLIDLSPQFALAAAEMAVANSGGHQGSDDFNRGLGGPVNEAAGVRGPSVGMGANQNQLPAAPGPSVGAPQVIA